MSYATYLQVGDVCGYAFSAQSSPVDSTQVEGYIDQIGSEMRGALSAGGYDPDPTEENAVNILELYACLGVSAMVMQAGKRTEDASVFQRRYDAWLSLARQGKAAGLTVLGTAAALPSSRYTRSPSTYPEPAFKRSEVQW